MEKEVTTRPIDFIIGGRRKTAITQKHCVVCRADVKEFRDNISKREFEISGLCQVCQDAAFAPV